MDIVGIDISKAKFDTALLIGERVRHAAFSNTQAGFEQFLAWLARHRPDQAAPLHACLEATGNWGLELAAFLHGRGMRVSVVNPVWPAFGRTRLASRPSRSDPTAKQTAAKPPEGSRPRGCCLPSLCVSFASWSAAATRSKQPACRR